MAKTVDTEARSPELERLLASSPRVAVNKAYKMFVGGAFVRSESGRYFQVAGHGGADPEIVNVPRASRKDVRDAVVAAMGALGGWGARSAFNRGQILYRLAEVMEARKDELQASLVRGGVGQDDAAREVACAVDRSVYYAGFADKFHALVASQNPVAGPHFGFSIPDAMGVVGVLAPERPALLGLVSALLPVMTGGNTAVVVASDADPRTAISFCECLATSDVPAGVANVLTGRAKELAPALAKHREVAALGAWTLDAELRAELEREGADNVKRVRARAPLGHDAWFDDRLGQGIGWIEAFVETKTVWHPVGV